MPSREPSGTFARRIVPALVLVCVCTAALSLAVLLPGELKRFATSLIATAFSVSNFWCLHQSGYFEPAAETPVVPVSVNRNEAFSVPW